MKLVISEKVVLQVKESIKFLSAVSTQAARDLLDEVELELKKITSFPNSNPPVQGLHIENIKYRKAIMSKGRYAFIYSVNEEEIYVHLFIDFRRDNSVLLSDLN